MNSLKINEETIFQNPTYKKLRIHQNYRLSLFSLMMLSVRRTFGKQCKNHAQFYAILIIHENGKCIKTHYSNRAIVPDCQQVSLIFYV